MVLSVDTEMRLCLSLVIDLEKCIMSVGCFSLMECLFNFLVSYVFNMFHKQFPFLHFFHFFSKIVTYEDHVQYISF